MEMKQNRTISLRPYHGHFIMHISEPLQWRSPWLPSEFKTQRFENTKIMMDQAMRLRRNVANNLLVIQLSHV